MRRLKENMPQSRLPRIPFWVTAICMAVAVIVAAQAGAKLSRERAHAAARRILAPAEMSSLQDATPRAQLKPQVAAAQCTKSSSTQSVIMAASRKVE